MFNTKRYKKAVFTALAVGAIGFAAAGVLNTVQSYNDVAQAAEITTGQDAGAGLISSGSGCSPLGCAACGLCSLGQQYQQSVVIQTNVTY